ncbi:nuclear transcription factor Y subunit B-4-like [Wolffia australiana]
MSLFPFFPREMISSEVGNANESDGSSGLPARPEAYVDNNGELDLLLPLANVGRIMKKILPPNAKVSQEAKETMQESATEFVRFVTSEAATKCMKEDRKTINGDDICWALENVGLNNYASASRRYLQKYRDDELARLVASQGGPADEEYHTLRLFEGSKETSINRR